MYCGGREKRVEPAWTGKTAWNLRGVGKNAWNPRGFIAQNPRKVRGVHALCGFDGNLMYYHYLHSPQKNMPCHFSFNSLKELPLQFPNHKSHVKDTFSILFWDISIY